MNFTLKKGFEIGNLIKTLGYFKMEKYLMQLKWGSMEKNLINKLIKIK